MTRRIFIFAPLIFAFVCLLAFPPPWDMRIFLSVVIGDGLYSIIQAIRFRAQLRR